MLIESTKCINVSANISENAINNIKKYIQGSVYCWCKNCRTNEEEPKWFSASDLFGGENYYWEGTPLVELYNWHLSNKAVDPVSMAGQDVGHLLRDVISDDLRSFNTRVEYTREYKWDGK
jgi:ligand-binding sensor protein